jgi:hypothetical protein
MCNSKIKKFLSPTIIDYHHQISMTYFQLGLKKSINGLTSKNGWNVAPSLRGSNALKQN